MAEEKTNEVADVQAPETEQTVDNTPVQEGPVPLTLELRVDAFTNEVRNRIAHVVSSMKNEEDKTFETGIDLGVTVATDIEEAFDPKQAQPMAGEPVLFAVDLKGVGSLRVGTFNAADKTLISTENQGGVYKLEEIAYWRPVSNTMRAFRSIMMQRMESELKDGKGQCPTCSADGKDCQCDGKCDCSNKPETENETTAQ